MRISSTPLAAYRCSESSLGHGLGCCYEVVNQTFKEVFIENSGSARGLSEAKAVPCSAGKRVIGGGTNLGTNPAQNGQQRGTSIDLRVFAICAAT